MRVLEFIDSNRSSLAYHLSYDAQAVQPHLKSAAARKAALRTSAQTSSAIEGIRAPFAKSKHTDVPASTEDFIAHWKRRVAATAR